MQVAWLRTAQTIEELKHPLIAPTNVMFHTWSPTTMMNSVEVKQNLCENQANLYASKLSAE